MMKRTKPSITKPTGPKEKWIGAIHIKWVQYKPDDWRLEAKWRDPGKPPGKERCKQWFYNWRHAEEFAAKENKRLDELKEKGAGRFTVGDALNSYLKEREALSKRKDNKGCTRDTFNDLQTIIENHIRPRFDRVRLAQLSSQQIKEWIIEQCGKLKTRTVDKHFAILKCVLKHAVEYDMLTVNPLSVKKVKVPGERSQRVKIPARSDLEVLREYLNQPRPVKYHRFKWSCLRMIVFFALSCGLRAGEMSALEWDDIDRETGEIEIKRSRAPLQGLKGPKSKSGNRKIPTTLWGRQIIDEHAEVYKEFYGKCVGPVLKARDSDFMTSHQVSRIFTEALQRCGLVDSETNQTKFACHAGRHWTASHWLKSTADIHQTKKWLGHKHASMTLDTYGHLLDDPEARAKFERMPDWLIPVIESDAPPVQQPSPLTLPAPEESIVFDSNAGNGQIEAKCPIDVPSIAEPYVRPFIELLWKGMEVGEVYCEIAPLIPNLRSTKNPQPLKMPVVHMRVAKEFRRLKLPPPTTLASRFRAERILALHAKGYQSHEIAKMVGCHYTLVNMVRQARHKPNANNPLNRKLNTPRPNAREPQPEHKTQLKLL